MLSLLGLPATAGFLGKFFAFQAALDSNSTPHGAWIVWLVVIALKPMIQNVYWVALLLLVAGGVLYSTGVIFYVNKRLKFSRAIWHGHVVAAAAAHWAAVLIGVVLVTR